MKVYLLTIDAGERVFYAEGPHAPAGDRAAAPSRGLRGWLERTSRRWHELGRSAEAGVGSRVRRAWHWLQRRMAPDEAMLRHLGRAAEVELYHPASLTAEEALRHWLDYLASRRYRHGLRLVLTLLLSPLTLLLMPIPGPNLIGYWFVYRAVCHLRALLGVQRALGGRVATRPHPTTALEVPPGLTQREWIARVARRYRLRGLGDFIERAAASREDDGPAPGVATRAAPREASAQPADREH